MFTQNQEQCLGKAKMRDRIAMPLPLPQPTRYNTQTTGMTEKITNTIKGGDLTEGLCTRSVGTA
eukprot:COSAG05_NODE_20839_length_276_cov_0.881356_1_plen_63_part_01